jgi:hypothetical protein
LNCFIVISIQGEFKSISADLPCDVSQTQVNFWSSGSQRQPGQLFFEPNYLSDRTDVLSKELAPKKKTKKPEPK